jgi:hypothetical protein
MLENRHFEHKKEFARNPQTLIITMVRPAGLEPATL